MEIKKEVIIFLMNSNKSIKEISKILNISIPTYYRIRKELNINTRKKGAGRPFGTNTIKLI